MSYMLPFLLQKYFRIFNNFSHIEKQVIIYLSVMDIVIFCSFFPFFCRQNFDDVEGTSYDVMVKSFHSSRFMLSIVV